jgi:hypothetical protein
MPVPVTFLFYFNMQLDFHFDILVCCIPLLLKLVIYLLLLISKVTVNFKLFVNLIYVQKNRTGS